MSGLFWFLPLTPYDLPFTPYDGRCAMLYGFLRTRDTGHGHVFNRIGWKNICKLWLEERNPEQLKGEGNEISGKQNK